jgi:hypothetical protein
MGFGRVDSSGVPDHHGAHGKNAQAVCFSLEESMAPDQVKEAKVLAKALMPSK